MFANPHQDPDFQVGELEHSLMSVVDELRHRAQTPAAVYMDAGILSMAISKLYDTRGHLRELAGN